MTFKIIRLLNPSVWCARKCVDSGIQICPNIKWKMLIKSYFFVLWLSFCFQFCFFRLFLCQLSYLMLSHRKRSNKKPAIASNTARKWLKTKSKTKHKMIVNGRTTKQKPKQKPQPFKRHFYIESFLSGSSIIKKIVTYLVAQPIIVVVFRDQFVCLSILTQTQNVQVVCFVVLGRYVHWAKQKWLNCSIKMCIKEKYLRV